VVLKVKASEIIGNSSRFDLGVKYNYAKSLVNLGYVPSVYVQDYLEHINCFNSFYESEPIKKSPNDFIKAFDSLIQSLIKNGFHETQNKILITNEGELINGAHRVSAAAALDSEIEVHIVQEKDEVYDFAYFQGKNLSENVSDRGAIGTLEIESDTRLLIVYPVVSNRFESEIEIQIAKRGMLFYKKLVPANFNLISNIKLLNYYIYGDVNHQAWIGTASNMFRGIQAHAQNSMGSGKIRFYLIRNISNEDFLQLKSDLRKLFGVDNFSLHGTDTFSETQDVIRTVCHSESLKCAKASLKPATLKLAGWLKELAGSIEDNRSIKSHFCIGGSGSLAAFGARQISDLDLLSERTLEDFQKIGFVSFHNLDEIPYPSKVREYLIDPEKHFYFLGFKFISVRELQKMKMKRRETKDLYDLRLLEEIIERKTWSSNILTWSRNRLLTMIYWGIRHYVRTFLLASKLFLARSPHLMKLLKKIKSFLKFH
jgi:hypothetical protein